MTLRSRQAAAPTSAERWIRISAGVLVAAALVTLLTRPPASAARLAAPPVHLLPGLERARSSDAAGIGGLSRYLPKRMARAVRSARRDAAAAAGGGQRVQVTVLELGKAKHARRVVAGWRAGARRAGARPRRGRVGAGGWSTARGAQVTVVWRSRAGVGLVRFRGRARPSRTERALAFARLADVGLSAPPPATAWERVLDKTHPDGTPSKRAAMQAFALAYGRLPGVRVPSGPAGHAHGTLAVGWILHYRSSLTSKQRRVVDRKLGLPRRGGGARAGQYEAAVDDTTFTDDPTFKRDKDIEALVDGYVNQILAKIGAGRYIIQAPEPWTFEVVAGTSEQTGSDGTAAADTAPFDEHGRTGGDASGEMYTCRVRVFLPNMKGAPEHIYLNTLAHEAFHCVDNWVGSRTWGPELPWLEEGLAQWAGDTLVPVSYYDPNKSVMNYVEAGPQPPVFLWEKGYAAVGLFGHLHDAFGDLWPRVLKTLEAEGNVEAFVRAGGNVPSAFESWGSSRFRIPDGGLDWMMISPVVVPTYYEGVEPGGEQQIVGIGAATALPYSTAQAVIHADPEAPIVRVRVEGFGRLMPLLGPGVPVQDRIVRDGELWLCVGGDCSCPAGSSGSPPSTQPWSFPSALALTGPAGAAIQSYPLDWFCQPEAPPTTPAQPLDCSSGGCGSSNGDPHLETFDGLNYEFQAVGEFTLVKSRSGDLEVQARQQPARTLGGIPNDALSINTALAMRVGGARVGVYATRSGMQVRVNGRPVSRPTGGASLSLDGGGALADRSGQLAVVWPDGSELRVWLVPPAGLTTMMRPASSRTAQLVGLLGNFDSDRANDFATRAGTPLESAALLGGGSRAFKLLYGRFGDSWRIRQRDSLFDYRRGRSTRSYTRRGFPRRPLSAGSLPRRVRRRAAAICRAAGVRNPVVLENCILDVAATGERAFARDAVTLEATGRRGPVLELEPLPGPILEIEPMGLEGQRRAR